MDDWRTEWERRQPREIPPGHPPVPPEVTRRAVVLVLLALALVVLYYIPITYGT